MPGANNLEVHRLGLEPQAVRLHGRGLNGFRSIGYAGSK